MSGFQSLVVAGILFLLPAVVASAVEVELASAPENNLSLTLKAIRSAKRSVHLNIYELTSPEIVAELANQIRAGIHVEILEEGQPVGGLSTNAKAVQKQLVQAMSEASAGDHFYEMTSKTRAKRRFRYDHAKYAVIDGESLLIGSENYSPTGNPKAGIAGNRGWEVFVHDESVAKDFLSTFSSDTKTSYGDIVDLATADTGDVAPPSDNGPEPWDLLLAMALPIRASLGAKAAGPAPAAAGMVVEARSVKRITSPETSLSGLLQMIRQARKTLDIEQLTFDSEWGSDGDQSPLLNAVKEAASRGVRVRVLLNDEAVFERSENLSRKKNPVTVETLNDLAEKEGLQLSARIADVKSMHVDYIHNKGALVDGDQTLISSINWDENAVEHNREAAVLLTSPEANRYYSGLFEKDWSASAN